jgi:AraC-like DNA-binding protein
MLNFAAETMNMRSLMSRMMALVCLLACLQLQAKESRFYVYNSSNGLADNSAQTLHCTKTGRLVITTMGQINFFDGNYFTYIDPTSENIYPLSNYQGNYHLYFDRFHHLWLKNTHNVTCVDLTTEKFVHSVEDVFEEFGMKDPVTDVFVDGDNLVWLLTKNGLYNVASQKTYEVKRGLNLQDVDVWQERYLLLCYENGLMEIYDTEQQQKIYEGIPYDQASEEMYNRTSVLKIVGDACYQIRDGSKEGILMKFDLKEKTWTTLFKTPYRMSNIAERDSVLYIPSEYGYWTYDLATDKKEHIEMIDMASGGSLLTDMNAIVFDKQGGMWIGTEKRGLLYARPLVSPFQVYGWTNPRALELARLLDQMPPTTTSYRGKQVNCVFTDSRGWDWVGTSSGLQVYKEKTDHLPVVYTKSDGLLNNVIHTIIEDKLHNIWVGTSFGLSCLMMDGNKLHFINSYNQWDNIPSESFVNGKALILPNGSIAMQMLDHVVEFNPQKMGTVLNNEKYDFYPKLVRVMVNGNILHTGEELDGKVILEKAIPRTSEINLSYFQNSVTLTFSALNYFRPQQTYYRVRINGLDNTWRVLTSYNSGGLVDSRGMLHLPMVALKPGTYSIEVQASMIPDVWDTVPYEWVINVNEPWWRTTGVMWLIGLLLIVLLAVNTYYYMRNVSMRATRNSQEQGIVRQIHNFAEHCSRQETVLLEPVPDEYAGVENGNQNALTPEFIATMEKIIPTVLKKETEKLTMRELSAVAKMELQPFYQVILGNIFKSPRPLAKSLMLRKAEELLTTTEKDMEAIASECGFVSPNYFIATFYRKNKMTPEIYRRQNSHLRRKTNKTIN